MKRRQQWVLTKGEASVQREATNRITQGAALAPSCLMFLQVILLYKASVLLIFAHSIKETVLIFLGEACKAKNWRSKVTGDTKMGWSSKLLNTRSYIHGAIVRTATLRWELINWKWLRRKRSKEHWLIIGWLKLSSDATTRRSKCDPRICQSSYFQRRQVIVVIA